MPARTFNKGYKNKKPKKGFNSSNQHQRKQNGERSVAQLVREERAVVSRNSQQSETREVYDRNATRKAGERAFFNEFFKDEPEFLNKYNERVSKSPDGVINWDFLPFISRDNGTQSYCRVLHYVRNTIESARIDRADNLRDLKGPAENIIKTRENDIARHQNVCDIWKGVGDAIDQKQNEIKFLETQVPDEGRGGRRSSKNCFLRLLCCCCS